MKESLLELLACPNCAGDIALLEIERREQNEILSGELGCQNCAQIFPILRGVPRFADLGEIETDKAATAANFGWQWTNFTQTDERYAAQFLDWLKPVRREFFVGKTVLEIGCGKGRHTVLAREWNAQTVVGVDLGDGVETAFAATRKFENAHIVQADVFRLPFKRAFDYAFSVGVLHHTPAPQRAFAAMTDKIKTGGWISAWVYGRENNGWIVNFVNPVRTNFTAKLNKSALFQLSKLPTTAVFAATKLLYRPLNRRAKNLANKLFYNDYLNYIADFGWREQHNIVFDHLVAPTAFYIERGEFESWWRDTENVQITWHNRNSWCGFGQIKR